MQFSDTVYGIVWRKRRRGKQFIYYSDTVSGMEVLYGQISCENHDGFRFDKVLKFVAVAYIKVPYLARAA